MREAQRERRARHAPLPLPLPEAAAFSMLARYAAAADAERRQRCLPLPKIFAAPRRHMSYAIYARCLPLSARAAFFPPPPTPCRWRLLPQPPSAAFQAAEAWRFAAFVAVIAAATIAAMATPRLLEARLTPPRSPPPPLPPALRYAPPRQIRRLPPAFFAMKPAAIHADSAAA
jgi:hypothetical protein